MKTKLIEEMYGKLHYAKKIVAGFPKESLETSNFVYKLAKSKDFKSLEAYALLSIALYNRIKSDTSSMLENSYEALAIFKKEKDLKGQIEAFNLIGIAYFYNSMYDEALNYFLKGKNLLKANKNTSMLTRILNNIGEVYRESEKYKDAMSYYNMSIKIIDKKNNPLNYAVILLNIGEVYFTKGEFNRALKAYDESYNIFLETDEMVYLGDTENKIGKIFFQTGDLEKAEKYYLQALNRLKKVNHKYYLIEVLINLGQLYDRQPDNKAIKSYKEGVQLAETIGAKKKLSKLYNLLSEYFEIEGDYKKALVYNKKYFNINEEVRGTSLKNKLEILNIGIRNIESEEGIENIISRLEKEIQKQAEELEKIKNSHKMLEKKVYEDELTGVENRRSINIYINTLLNDNKFFDTNLVLFMIDIDKFKKYNDYWGHAEGDNCIKKIAECIKNIQISYGHKFARYGGEEFIYIANSKSYEEAIKLGNLIRRQVEDLKLYYMVGNERIATTISLGGVIGKINGFSSIREIIELADEELYSAKNKGRNIVILKKHSTIEKNIFNQSDYINIKTKG